jgi:hypothetical protein
MGGPIYVPAAFNHVTWIPSDLKARSRVGTSQFRDQTKRDRIALHLSRYYGRPATTPGVQFYDHRPAEVITGSKFPRKQSAETCLPRGYK